MSGRWFTRLLLTMVLVLFSGCAPFPGDEETIVKSPRFPVNVAGCVAAGESHDYDTDSIYAYIDGHAEVYMAYGMKRCVSQRYSGPDGGTELVVDLFEMASPADSYGVFSHDRSGEIVDVGQGGVFRHGWLSFWTGPWYGSVYSTGGDQDSRQTVLDLGRSVAETLPGGGAIPEIVSMLPSNGLDDSSVCFLRSPQILNAHTYVGGDNVFGLDPGTEAVVGSYVLGEATASLILVRYPSASAARAVEDRAKETASVDSNRPVMLLGRNEALLAAVVGSDSDAIAEALLIEALGGQS